MHGTGCWLGLMFPHMLGGTSVLLENRGFKPEEVWRHDRARSGLANHHCG